MAERRRVLVTGGAGFIGGHLAGALLADGWEVEIADDLSTGTLANVSDGAGFHQIDLGRPGALDELGDRRFDAIAHLAGQSSGEKSFDDPVRDFDANARSTVMLADWALRRGVPVLVHASSMGVYGQPHEPPISEHSPLTPISWYGASKGAAERSLEVAARQGLRTCSLRMFSIYGPGQDLSDLRQGMVSIFLSMILRGEPVVVRGSLERVRDFVYIEDCIEAWRLALERPASGALNLGTGEGTSVRRMIELLLAARGADPEYPVRSEGETPGDQFAVWADASRIRETLGWRARWTLSDGLEAMVAWAVDGRP